LALLTLSTLEIVLGIDNLVFVSIAVSKLPPEKRPWARKFGLALACVTRIMLLVSLVFLARMQASLFSLFGQEFSIRDLVLIGGGLFLLIKGTMEIHDAVEGAEEGDSAGSKPSAVFGMVIAQIAIIDIVFSLDSVITAVGMVDNIPVMAAAIIIAVGVMIFASDPIGEFIDRHPTVHRSPSDGQDAGAVVPHPGRYGTDRGWSRVSHSACLSVFRHGLFGHGGNAEHGGAPQTGTQKGSLMSGPEYPALYLKRGEDKRLRAGHLWVFSNEVDTAKSPLTEFPVGGPVWILDASGKPLGTGYANPSTLICGRLVDRGGKPLDRSLITHRLNVALSLRERLRTEPFYRLVFGETDGLPGLIIDRFDDIVVAQLNTAGMQAVRGYAGGARGSAGSHRKGSQAFRAGLEERQFCACIGRLAGAGRSCFWNGAGTRSGQGRRIGL